MKNIILLVVDIQEALVSKHPINEKTMLLNVQRLVEAARLEEIEVIYIRHDGGTGDELERHTEGWQIHHKIAPKPHDKIFDKLFNSAFKDTGLGEYLESKGIQAIVLVGLQTEYCIDTTCKAAFEYGYEIIIPQGTTSTYDNNFFPGGTLARYYEEQIWKDRFAKLMGVDETIEIFSGPNV